MTVTPRDISMYGNSTAIRSTMTQLRLEVPARLQARWNNCPSVQQVSESVLPLAHVDWFATFDCFDSVV